MRFGIHGWYVMVKGPSSDEAYFLKMIGKECRVRMRSSQPGISCFNTFFENNKNSYPPTHPSNLSPINLSPLTQSHFQVILQTYVSVAFLMDTYFGRRGDQLSGWRMLSTSSCSTRSLGVSAFHWVRAPIRKLWLSQIVQTSPLSSESLLVSSSSESSKLQNIYIYIYIL